MAFYARKERLRDGRILLYLTPTQKQPIWQMRLNLRGLENYITKSTRTTSLAEAARIAEDEYDKLSTRIREGAPIDDWTFEAHWKEWFERMVRRGEWKQARQKWHRMYYNRYFSEYFGQRLLNDITAEFVDAYWDWRIAYWQTGTGAKIRDEDPSRRNSKLIPGSKTLNMEQTALNQMFSDAHRMRRMTYFSKFKSPKRHTINRRPSFTLDEWNVLTRNLQSYADVVGRFALQDTERVHSLHRVQRLKLKQYVLFTANTGLRVGELRQLRWEDITEFYDDDGETKLRVYVRKEGKTRQRVTISQPIAVEHISKWRDVSKFTEPQDYIWYGQKRDDNGRGLPHKDFNKIFTRFLSQVPYKQRKGGLLNDADGDKRTLYSLRHFYATTRLLRGDISVFDLALNMGTSVKQIENHYNHVITEQRSVQITRIVDKVTKENTLRNKMIIDLVELAERGDAEQAKALLETLVARK